MTLFIFKKIHFITFLFLCYLITESETETPKKFPRLSLETEKKPRPSQALVRFHEEWNEQSKTLKFKNELHRNSFSLFVLCITLFIKNTIFLVDKNVLFAFCVFWKLCFCVIHLKNCQSKIVIWNTHDLPNKIINTNK